MREIDPSLKLICERRHLAADQQGEIDASLDFTTNVPYTISLQGVEATSFLLYDFGYTTYNDTIVVTEAVLAEKRDLLVAWLRAARKGQALALKLAQSTIQVRRTEPAPDSMAEGEGAR